MSERNLEQALAHAERWKDVPDVTIVVDALGVTFVADLMLLADAYHEKDLALTLVCSEVNQLKARAVMFAHEFREFCASCGKPLPHDAGSHIHIARQGCYVCGLPSDDPIHAKESS